MPESFARGDQPKLGEVARSDLLLDSLAARHPVRLDDPDDDALAALLEDWRDDLRWPPASALVSPEEAVAALRTGLAERHRGRRGLATLGSVAATLLVLSGFGAMVVEARPGDTLYGLHAMFFDQPRVNDDRVLLSAKADLAKVQQMIDQGEWDQAQNQLAEVSSALQSVDDPATRHDLMDEVNLLNTRVESRNPSATLPASAAPTTTPAAPSATSAAPPAAGTTVAPSQSASPSPAPSSAPSSSPTSTKHHHHSHSTSPSAGTPAAGP